MAGDRRRRLRRLSGRAAGLGADLAGRGASRGPGDDARGLAGALGGRGGTVRPGAAPATFDDPELDAELSVRDEADASGAGRRRARAARRRAAARPRGASTAAGTTRWPSATRRRRRAGRRLPATGDPTILAGDGSRDLVRPDPGAAGRRPG